MNAIQSVLSAEQKSQFKPVAIQLKAGECSFHHPLMVHGSFENRSDRPRRGAVINVFRDGVRTTILCSQACQQRRPAKDRRAILSSACQS